MSSTLPDPSKWRKVSEKEFFKEIEKTNCKRLLLLGKYPYTSVYKTPEGKEVGMLVPSKRFTRQYRILVQLKDFYLPKASE